VILDQLQSAIADRYKVERELGRGGMATVFLATDVRHERQVAIKVLHPDLAATIGAERFEREIKLAAKLQHPHILGLIDSGEANGLFYYVMPFIQGESVRDKLDREKQLGIDEAIQITLEVADALGYAHAQNIVHRDIKPENVMMSNGHALVADFGIARARTEAGQSKLTQTGMAVGTPVYMSPEQATGEAVGPSADIYSLGCMLYEMLAGEPPFQGPNAMAIMARHAMEAVPSVRIIRPAVPEEVEEAILAAMEKNVPDRPKTAAEFCEILGTPLGATATRRVTGRHTARHRVPTGARLPAFTTAEAEAKLASRTPLWKRPVPLIGGVAVGLALIAGIWSAWSGRAANAAVGDSVTEKRIAVMYFDDRTDGRLGYFADGLTETLIDQLRPVRELDVLSKDAVSRFRGGSSSVDSVINALAPGTIVRGAVSQDGSQIRVSVNVMDERGSDRGDALIFAHPANDELGLRQIVTDSVTSYLRQFVGGELEKRRIEAGTSNRLAFSLFQQAEKRRKEALAAAAARDSTAATRNFDIADSLLGDAEKLDNKWASPIALRATVALNRARSSRAAAAKRSLIDVGFAHADRALKLDPRNIDALEARGRLYHERWGLQLEEDKGSRARALLDSAHADYEKVVTADPQRVIAWISKSQVEAQLMDQLSAYESANRAYEEDAYFSGVETVLRQRFATAHDLQQFTKAQEHCDEAARRFPRNWNFVSCKLVMRATNTVNSGPDSAWKELETLSQLLPANEKELQVRRHQMFVALTLARQENLKDSARKVIERARADQTIDPTGRLLTAEALARLRLNTPADTVIALQKLREYVISQPLHGAGFANTPHWWWAGLKADKRWSDYLEKGVTGR
jgi:TolB-like protein/tetratricopeptide (TPR) repeat protein